MPRATLYTRVPPEVKARALRQAELEGVPLNVWVTQLILTHAPPLTPEPLPGQTTLEGTELLADAWVRKAIG